MKHDRRRVPTTDLTTTSFVEHVVNDLRLQRIVNRSPEQEHEDLMQTMRQALFQAKREHDPSRGPTKRNHAVIKARQAGLNHLTKRTRHADDEVTASPEKLQAALQSAFVGPGDDQLTPEKAVELIKMRRLIYAAVRELKNENQQECILAWLREEPWAETAERLGLREDYCSALKAKGIERLCAMLSSVSDSPE